MTICEYESIAFNNEVRNDEIDNFMITARGSITSLAEAQDKLYQAVKYMKKLKDTIEVLKKDLRMEN
jgi:two-component sensor histidine kinase